MVNDVLSPFPNYKDTDPFILLHEFGPTSKLPNIPVGLHPHRGFNEVPYLKQGRWVPLDYWNPDGDPSQPTCSGMLQWGKVGSGIEHGAKFDRSYTGPLHGFQLWVNLPSAQKMDPPCFQDAQPEALPEIQLSPLVTAKLLVGELAGQSSPMDTGSVRVQYIDFIMAAGGTVMHPIADGLSSVYVYVYQGSGTVGSTKQAARRGEVLRIESGCQALDLSADKGEAFGCLFLAGAPLKEPIVQHGPFVMSSQEQIRQAFADFQRGRLCNDTCNYVLHKPEGPVKTQRSVRR
eukprot:gnl/TRDRNA2_/TRDRNA2_74722_c0_seq1.p1 gnl/TRDRNA2_/TRDRNA2_74722_c0~~gnl/TRDRNA2_/TRDRNA2_74722_c0_seq1.p1  ORF type:complete len:303 (-),score=51.05 gnl/TRDRNA2_/TRDRNA2_74722_c0_seq1:377-1246(-)